MHPVDLCLALACSPSLFLKLSRPTRAMGVPAFFVWLSKRYPGVVNVVKEEKVRREASSSLSYLPSPSLSLSLSLSLSRPVIEPADHTQPCPDTARRALLRRLLRPPFSPSRSRPA